MPLTKIMPRLYIISEDAVIDFADDEWILRINAGTEGEKGQLTP